MIIIDILIALALVILCGRLIINLILGVAQILWGFVLFLGGVVLWMLGCVMNGIEFIFRALAKLWRIAIGQEK